MLVFSYDQKKRQEEELNLMVGYGGTITRPHETINIL